MNYRPREEEMPQIAPPENVRIALEAWLRQTVDGLAALDAERLEAWLERLERISRDVAGLSVSIELPKSSRDWERIEEQRRILAHLLLSTGRQLTVLRRISAPAAPFGGYGRGEESSRPIEICRVGHRGRTPDAGAGNRPAAHL